ncbi:hypothetical protein EVAR_46329_1 [Eumeta japonica]|uniref:Uncharacterized protein n=1 Tax=Eumeta variegata TaxID=151549 RepID=A0A4C1WVU2_EUMVA|nr:hypothetical protein EVAR_46329_1 [Eumeta japonica]
MSRRDGFPLDGTRHPEKTVESKRFSARLVLYAPLGIRVEAPFKKVDPVNVTVSKYGHAAANCHADPRCVKCLVPHWTKEFAHESEEKPPKLPPCAPRDLENFPASRLQQKTTPVVNFHPAPAPSTNPWGRNQPPRAVPEPSREPARRAPPAPRPETASVGPSSFGDDIQTVMAVLRAVSSSEIAEFAGQLRACRNVEEKLLVLVRYHDLMKNIPELTNCMSEYEIDIALIQETFLKPNRPRACAIAGYVQLRTDRTYARKGGTALYYNRSLHCCPITIPPLVNMEATGYRLAMTGHRTIIIVSVYLPSPKPLSERP